MSISARAKWKHGLYTGFIGAVAGTAESGIAVLIIDPTKFQYENLPRTVLALFLVCIARGIQVASAYLKQSPLPPLEDEGKDV